MSAVLPGKPESRLQGLTTGYWDNKHISVYVTGNAISILSGTHTVLQTIYDDDETPLEAVAFDEYTGKIAVCTHRLVRVYKPLGLGEDTLKWALQLNFEIRNRTAGASACLSWGASEELLVASKALTLYSTKADPIVLWEKQLPNSAKSATVAYDSAYIASIGSYDKTPKVWRRLTYGQDEIRFDLTYLRHPDLVTSMRWRKPFHVEQAAENVLYTMCVDCTVRIWTPTDTIDGKHWQLWGQVDIAAPLQRGLEPREPRLVFIVDGRDFTASVERAVERRMKDDESTDDVGMDHLVAVANRNPEICLAIDSGGLLSAWAFENVGSVKTSSTQIFNIAQVASKQFESLGGFLRLGDDLETLPHIEVQTYCDRQCGSLHILLHSFDGRIGLFTTNVADLFDPTTNDRRLALTTVWSGHSASIKKIVRNFSGSAIVSRTGSGESVVWRHGLKTKGEKYHGLMRQSVIPEQKKNSIHRICVLRKGKFVIFLLSSSVILWDCRTHRAQRIAEVQFDVEGKPICLILLPRPDPQDFATAYVAIVTTEGKGVVWEATLPDHSSHPSAANGAGLEEFCRFEMPLTDLDYILPVDPAGSSPVRSGFLDVFARDVAISYTKTGRVNCWTARVDQYAQTVDWFSTCSTETSIPNLSLVSGSMLRKAAMVNSTRSQITIWDIGGARLEYNAEYKTHNTIQDLDWTSTPDSQSILAVGFQSKVVLLSQMRFDYLNKGPAWAPVREISIRELTPHPIGDSAWLGNGHLVIGAGNQMFVQDRRVDASEISAEDIMRLPPRKEGTWDLFEAVQRFNGPLPVFHPQFLSQCILGGKSSLVRRILVELRKTLKFHIEGEKVDEYLGIEVAEFYAGDENISSRPALQRGTSAYLSETNGHDKDEEETFSEETAQHINEKLLKVSIPQLSRHEQIQLADITECVGLVERHRRSMDENGGRFMLFFRQNALRRGRTNQMFLSWREVNWAFHSSSQDILVDFVSKQWHGQMLWDNARQSGIFMWLSDSNALRAQLEIVARTEYTKAEDKNPVGCSLFYLALKKKTVLQGLWRMAHGNREQAATMKVLANDFDDPQNKTKALKNAYALLSKRRFEYAAAFFLLAGNLESAVEVCLRQLKDVQLGIAIARVYGGDQSPIFKKLLHEEILPLAAQEGNRWLASWAFWMLGRKDVAVRALVIPVYALVETPCSPDIKSRLFLSDDPALVVLYEQLRQQTLQTLRGASKVTPKVEWEFVLHSAKLYDRMGCDLLGLALVRNWEFQQASQAVGLGGEMNPLKLLRRRSSLVVADLPYDKLGLGRGGEMQKTDHGDGRERHSSGKTKKGEERNQPATFVEPEANSLLDSFGF